MDGPKEKMLAEAANRARQDEYDQYFNAVLGGDAVANAGDRLRKGLALIEKAEVARMEDAKC